MTALRHLTVCLHCYLGVAVGDGGCRGLRGLAIIEVEQAAEPFRLHDVPGFGCAWVVEARLCRRRPRPRVREGDHVVQSLMIPFVMVMGEVFGKDMAERAFAKEDQLIETFLFDGAHPALGDGVEIGRLRGQFRGRTQVSGAGWIRCGPKPRRAFSAKAWWNHGQIRPARRDVCGDYTLTATAVDPEGRTSTSLPVTFTSYRRRPIRLRRR